jgi:hypothetical protein
VLVQVAYLPSQHCALSVAVPLLLSLQVQLLGAVQVHLPHLVAPLYPLNDTAQPVVLGYGEQFAVV